MFLLNICLLLFFAVPSLALEVNSTLDDRKIWSRCGTKNESNGITQTCRCGDKIQDAIRCSDNTNSLLIQPCYCVFYEESENRTLAGNCMITCFNGFTGSITRYSITNGSDFNEDMCHMLLSGKDSHREGRFCGRCKKDFGLAVYSYHYTTCIPCKDYSFKNWLRYFAVALLPLTVFYFIVVLLKINVSSSRLSGSIFAIQCWLCPLQLRIFDGWLTYAMDVHSNTLEFKCFNILLSAMGMVNLDFFRTLYPYFCLHPKLNILHVVSLDFIVALYPFFLIFLTYLLVTMHDRNCRFVVWAWKPFKCCLDQRYWGQLNPKGSLIETFATFIVLSNVKILGVCFDLLVPTKAYDETGSKLKVQYLYYDANIGYFSSQHLPFAVLALLIGVVFVLVPFLLLLLYPCRCFQRVLNALGCKCQALHIFMDVFQGRYKTQPYDLRYFSAYYFLLRFLILLTLTTGSVFYLSSTSFLLIVGGIVFAVFQPYKNISHNKFDIIALFTMVMFYTSLASCLVASQMDRHWLTLSVIMIVVSVVFLSAVALLPPVSFFLSFRRMRSMIARVRSVACKQKTLRQDSSTSLLIDTLDREDGRS